MNIVITGCTRGLGRALTEHYIKDGHTVIGCGRGADGILDLRFTHPAPQDFSVVDVAEATRVEMWAERVIGLFGAPDVVINNAGVMNQPAPLWDVPSAELSKLIDVNVKGPANVIRAFVPAMIKAGRGVIVNFSSGWGRSVSPDVAPYCASKYAIEGLTKALAEELPAPLAAVPLNPGVIDTDMLRQCWSDEAGRYSNPETWVKKAGPFILKLGRAQNGKSVSIAEFED